MTLMLGVRKRKRRGTMCVWDNVCVCKRDKVRERGNVGAHVSARVWEREGENVCSWESGCSCVCVWERGGIANVGMFVRKWVLLCVCMWERMLVCLWERECGCSCVCSCVCLYLCVRERENVGVHVCVCVCVCLWERERGCSCVCVRESVCVCVCVYSNWTITQAITLTINTEHQFFISVLYVRHMFYHFPK